MPVSVGKASSAGIPRQSLNRLSGALNRARVDATSFNIILRTIVTREGLTGVQSLGSFARGKLKQGLVRSEMTVAIRDHLNAEYRVPWDFLERTKPTALSRKFIPEEVQARIKKQKIQQQEARGQSGRPEWKTPPGSSYLKSNNPNSVPGGDQQ